MNPLYILLAICLSYSPLLGQIYYGTHLGKSKRLNATLRINADSTVNFILDQDENGVYAEYLGAIHQVRDSLFQIEAELTLGQFYRMAHGFDPIEFGVDAALVPKLPKITVTFANGWFTHRRPYNRYGKCIGIKIPAVPEWFNNTPGSNYYIISIPRKNPITGQALEFKIYYGSGAGFECDEKLNFSVCIQRGQLWTVGDAPLQWGHFRLRKSGAGARKMR